MAVAVVLSRQRRQSQRRSRPNKDGARPGSSPKSAPNKPKKSLFSACFALPEHPFHALIHLASSRWPGWFALIDIGPLSTPRPSFVCFGVVGGAKRRFRLAHWPWRPTTPTPTPTPKSTAERPGRALASRVLRRPDWVFHSVFIVTSVGLLAPASLAPDPMGGDRLWTIIIGFCVVFGVVNYHHHLDHPW